MISQEQLKTIIEKHYGPIIPQTHLYNLSISSTPLETISYMLMGYRHNNKDRNRLTLIKKDIELLESQIKLDLIENAMNL